MDPRLFIPFALLDVSLVLTPGPDWAFALAAGVRGSAIVASIVGLAGGYAINAGLVTIGVGGLIARNATALSVLTAVGAAYLLALGITIARRPTAIALGAGAPRSPVRAGLRGAAVSGLNPKGLLLFFAVLPQFVSAHASWPIAAQLGGLAAFHVAACTIVYLVVAFTASRLLSARPRAAELIGRGSGIAMIAVGLGLAAERLLAG
jgi:threonine/homoserine/homoserine lactone efflux protein